MRASWIANLAGVKNKDNEILPLAEERMNMKQDLLQKGLTPKTEMLTIQQQYIEMQRDRDTAAAHLAEAKSQIASIQCQKAQAQEGSSAIVARNWPMPRPRAKPSTRS